MNESEVGILVSKRIGRDAATRLSLQTMIPTALNNLARDVVNDHTKRRLLVSDKSVVTSSITREGGSYYSSVADLVTTYGVMIDYFQYGTVYHYFAPTFTSSDVNTGTDQIDIAAHPFTTGDEVVLSTQGALPSPLVAGTLYYVIRVGGNSIQLATSYQNAIDGTPINLATTGSGTSTITSTAISTLQWIDAPEFASLERSLPVQLIYGWMVKDRLYVSGATQGVLSYAVPFIPTLDTLPLQLDTDLIDELVTIATTGGGEPNLTEAQK